MIYYDLHDSKLSINVDICKQVYLNLPINELNHMLTVMLKISLNEL